MFREVLPENCPPENAEEIAGGKIMYRVIRTNPPTDADFHSQRAENPGKIFKTSECTARGLSVFAERSACLDLTKLPKLRGCLVCQIQLNQGAGYIMRTFQKPHHHTWWPLKEYNIIANCLVEE